MPTAQTASPRQATSATSVTVAPRAAISNSFLPPAQSGNPARFKRRSPERFPAPTAHALRQAAYANATRYPISATARAVTDLGPPEPRSGRSGTSLPGPRGESHYADRRDAPAKRETMTYDSDRIEALLDEGVRDKVYPGTVGAVGDTTGVRAQGATGVLDPDEPDIPMRADTVFDASLTTPTATSREQPTTSPHASWAASAASPASSPSSTTLLPSCATC